MSQKRYVAETLADLPDMEATLARSGLEFMQDVRDGKLAGPPIGALMGFWPTRVEEGKVIFTGTPEFKATNPMGTVHGGWYGTILDSCMACAVMTLVPKGSVYTTLEYKVNIIKSIPQNRQIRAIGTTNHVGRSTGVAMAEIIDLETGKLYATGSTTCIVMKM